MSVGALLFGNIAEAIVNKGGDLLIQKEETHKLEVKGQIKKDIINAEGKVKIEEIKEQGKVDIEKMKIENERQEINNAHEKDMKGMEYDYKIRDKQIEKDHEINVMRQQQEGRRKEEELKIKSDDHHAKNLREMKKLEGEIEVNMAIAKGDIEAKFKKLAIEDKAQDQAHEANMKKIDYTHEENLAKMKSEEEKFKLRNANDLEKIKNKHEVDMANIDLKKTEQNNNFLTKKEELANERKKNENDFELKKDALNKDYLLTKEIPK